MMMNMNRLCDLLRQDTTTDKKTQFLLVTRDDEYIVLQYYAGSQFIDPWLNEHLPSPEILMIGVMVFNCLLVCVLLTTHFAKILNKELFPLFKATKELENQNLDFEMEHSRIKEFENVLRSFDKMRNSLKNLWKNNGKPNKYNGNRLLHLHMI